MIVVRIAARKRDMWAWLLKPIAIYMMSLVDPDARGRVVGFSVCFTVFYSCFSLFSSWNFLFLMQKKTWFITKLTGETEEVLLF